MSILEDAHRRGVLRQTGGTYQFRHILLQERLAISPTTGRASNGGLPDAGQQPAADGESRS